MAFEKSDLFFICMLRPLSSEIKVDDLEIQAAKVKHSVDFSFFAFMSKLITKKDLCLDHRKIDRESNRK